MKNDGLSQLPKGPADRFTRPFLRFIRIEAYAGAALVVCASAALLLANSPWSARYLWLWEIPVGISIGDFAYARSLRHWINDGLMTLFFSLLRSN